MNEEVKEILEDLELCNGLYDYIREPEKSEILFNYIMQLKKKKKKQQEVIDMFLNKADKNKMLLNNPDLLDLYLKIKEVSEWKKKKTFLKLALIQ